MAQVAQSGTGNTSKSRTWFFTLNNPSEGDRDTLAQHSGVEELCFQVERGEGGTPHFQGVIKFKNARHFNSVKALLGVRYHLEKCRNWKAAVLYCKKEEGRELGPWHYKKGRLMREVIDYFDFELKTPWQDEIMTISSGDPSLRTIYWYWEPVGKKGKTTLARHLYIKGGVLYLSSGKGNDIKYAMKNLIDSADFPSLVIFDLPRSSEGYISWDAMESLKNGILFSGKYESGCAVFPIPHVIVLANFPPDTAKLSMDRWVIKFIE